MYNTITTDSALNPVKLAQAGAYFERMSRTRPGWARFTRESMASWPGYEIEPIGDVNNPKPSGAILETWEDTSKDQGGDHIRMPILGRLTKPPLGDTEAELQGEEIPIVYRDLYLAMYRKPFRLMTGMQAQRTPKAVLNAVNDHQSWLYNFWDEYFDGNCNHTLLTAYDVMLTDYRDLDGQILHTSHKAYSHPNLTVAGLGRVANQTASKAGTAGFETASVTALSGLVNQVAKGLTVARVRTYNALANRVGIPQMKIGGKNVTCWLIDQSQYLQLTNDKDWRDAFLLAGDRGKSNPLFSGAEAYMDGNLFFVHSNLFGVQHSGDSIVTTSGTYVTGTMPAYGPQNFWIGEDGTPLSKDTNSIKIAWILGPGALHRLYGRIRHNFEEQTGDFKKRKEMVHESYQSLCRGDMVDTNNEYGGGAGSVFSNRSSMPIATWSPFNEAV